MSQLEHTENFIYRYFWLHSTAISSCSWLNRLRNKTVSPMKSSWHQATPNTLYPIPINILIVLRQCLQWQASLENSHQTIILFRSSDTTYLWSVEWMLFKSRRSIRTCWLLITLLANSLFTLAFNVTRKYSLNKINLIFCWALDTWCHLSKVPKFYKF